MDAPSPEQRDAREQMRIIDQWLRAVGRKRVISRIALCGVIALLSLIADDFVASIHFMNTNSLDTLSVDPQQHHQARAVVAAVIDVATAGLILLLVGFRLLRFGVTRRFRRSLKEVTTTLPEGTTKATLTTLIRRMGVDERRIRIWIDMKGHGTTPSMYWSLWSHHIVVPLSFMTLLSQDKPLGGAVIAHELSHIVQSDVTIAIYTESILKVIWRVYIPLQILILLPISVLSIAGSVERSRDEAQAAFFAGARLGIPGEPPSAMSREDVAKAFARQHQAEADVYDDMKRGAFSVAVEMSLVLLLRYFRVQSETTADMAATTFVSGQALNRIFARATPPGWVGRLLHFVEPSVALRAAAYAKVSDRNPTLSHDVPLSPEAPWPYVRRVISYICTRLSTFDFLTLLSVCVFIPVAVGWTLVTGNPADEPIPLLWSPALQVIIAALISVLGLAMGILLILGRPRVITIGYIMFPLYFGFQAWFLYALLVIRTTPGMMNPDAPFVQTVVVKGGILLFVVLFGVNFYVSTARKLHARFATGHLSRIVA